jgi:hypothetical protein
VKKNWGWGIRLEKWRNFSSRKSLLFTKEWNRVYELLFIGNYHTFLLRGDEEGNTLMSEGLIQGIEMLKERSFSKEPFTFSAKFCELPMKMQFLLGAIHLIEC